MGRQAYAGAVKPWDQIPAAKLASIVYAPITPSCSPEYDWPDIEEIKKRQISSKPKPKRRFQRRSGIIQDDNDVVWIPSNDSEMK